MLFKFLPVSLLVHGSLLVQTPFNPCRGFVEDTGIYDGIQYIEIDIYLLRVHIHLCSQSPSFFIFDLFTCYGFHYVIILCKTDLWRQLFICKFLSVQLCYKTYSSTLFSPSTLYAVEHTEKHGILFIYIYISYTRLTWVYTRLYPYTVYVSFTVKVFV